MADNDIQAQAKRELARRELARRQAAKAAQIEAQNSRLGNVQPKLDVGFDQWAKAQGWQKTQDGWARDGGFRSDGGLKKEYETASDFERRQNDGIRSMSSPLAGQASVSPLAASRFDDASDPAKVAALADLAAKKNPGLSRDDVIKSEGRLAAGERGVGSAAATAGVNAFGGNIPRAMAALMDSFSGGSFSDAMTRRNAEADALAERFPRATTNAQIVGGAAQALVLPTSAVSTPFRAAATGAGLSAVPMAVRGDKPIEEIAASAAMGGLLGGIGQGISSAPEAAQDAARRMVERRLKSAQAPSIDFGREGLLIDSLGEQGVSMARAASQASPDAREMLIQALSSRQEGANERLMSAIERLSGSKGKSPVEMAENIETATRPAIRDAYRQLSELGQDIPFSELRPLLEAPQISRAFNSAKESDATRNAIAKFRGEEPASRSSQFDALDSARKRLRDSGREAMVSGRGDEGSAMLSAANELRDAIDARLASAPEARKLVQEREKRLSAVETGYDASRGATTEKLRQLARAARAAKDDTRAAFGVGLIDRLMGRSTPGQMAAMTGVGTQRGARLALGPKNYKELQKTLTKERVLSRPLQALGGSQTAEKASDMLREASNMGLIAGDIAFGSGTGAPGIIRALAQKLGGRMDRKKMEKLAPQIAELLVSKSLPQMKNITPPPIMNAIARAMLMSPSVISGMR